jgi:hypothetical protein
MTPTTAPLDAEGAPDPPGAALPDVVPLVADPFWLGLPPIPIAPVHAAKQTTNHGVATVRAATFV